MTVDASLNAPNGREMTEFNLVKRPENGWRKVGTRALPRLMDERSMVKSYIDCPQQVNIGIKPPNITQISGGRTTPLCEDRLSQENSGTQMPSKGRTETTGAYVIHWAIYEIAPS